MSNFYRQFTVRTDRIFQGNTKIIPFSASAANRNQHAAARAVPIAAAPAAFAHHFQLHPFGTRCKFHIDFLHACDYLVAAAKSTTMSDKERKCWFETQKESLRASKAKTVLATLGDLAEAKDGEEENELITTTISYLKKRENQFDYADAIRRELPIGSGEVESAHRHILQKRLKIPSAWWRLKRAEEMAQLCAMRANGRWNDFWQKMLPDHHFQLHPDEGKVGR